MPIVSYTEKAKRDLREIAGYTAKNFGVLRANEYGASLRNCLQSLANTPLLGRNADQHLADLRRFEYRSHVLLFKPTADGILVVRILHHRMDIFGHLES